MQLSRCPEGHVPVLTNVADDGTVRYRCFLRGGLHIAGPSAESVAKATGRWNALMSRPSLTEEDRATVERERSIHSNHVDCGNLELLDILDRISPPEPQGPWWTDGAVVRGPDGGSFSTLSPDAASVVAEVINREWNRREAGE